MAHKGVLVGNIWDFNLDSDVIYSILTFDHVVYLLQHKLLIVGMHMGGHGVLSNGNTPNVEVMHALNSLNGQDVLLHSLDMDASWCTLEQNIETTLQDWHHSDANDHREEISAKWICYFPFWVDVNACSGYNDTD